MEKRYKRMTWENAGKMTEVILHFASSNIDFAELRHDFMLSAQRYSNLRFKYFIIDSDGKGELEEERRLAHDAMIGLLNALVRHMYRLSPNSLPTELIPKERREIGDFACMFCAQVAIMAR